MGYWTKKGLYKSVERLKETLGINPLTVGIDVYDICKNHANIRIKTAEFSERTIRGFSVPCDNIIVLNSTRTKAERNFDCGHELIHVALHKTEKFQTFSCSDTLHPRQNSYIEWQANEGAAELLVPYKLFIPLFRQGIANCHSLEDYELLKENLSTLFRVPITVINFRIDNLKYEIQQYVEGRDIENLEILSNAQIDQRGLTCVSYNILFNFYDELAL